jgi:uncharacterized protein YfaS (alpha-2-macroglobulin family)
VEEEEVKMSYDRGETLIFTVRVYSDAAKTVLANATSVTFTLTDPDDTILVNGLAATNASTGVYTYTYTLPALAEYGLYTIKWLVNTTGSSTIDYSHFIVEKA